MTNRTEPQSTGRRPATALDRLFTGSGARGVGSTALRVVLLLAPTLLALGPVERAAIWTRVWSTANEHFVGFERIPYVNWGEQYAAGLAALQVERDDVEFWRDLRKRVALLENGGTYLRFPTTLPRTHDTVPVRLLLSGNKVLLRRLSSAPDLKAAGVHVGDELISIDGTPAFDYVRAACVEQTSGSTYESRLATGVHRIFTGIAGTRADCVWRRPDGTEYRAMLLRDTGPNSDWFSEFDKSAADDYRRLDGRIIYLNLRGSISRSAQESMLEIVRDGSTRALILDLRETQAGIVPTEFIRSVIEYPVQAWASRYIRMAPRESAGMLGVLDLQPAWTARDGVLLTPSMPRFAGPLICLVGRETSGAAERLLQPLVETGRAVLIGDTTAGAGYEQTVLQLGDGATLTLAITQPLWSGGHGDGQGFAPNVWVQPRASSLASAKDDVLERALQFARKGE
ncbi:hypothetical protein HZB60_06425 [candidate division KSB1 bacterium]|nr:hypothetical protein [candidate division KSB1 bacterium]